MIITDSDAEALSSLVVVLLLVTVLLVVTGWLLLRASNRPWPGGVVMALSVLGLVSLLGYAVGGEERPELAAIAGTAVGALAGGVTSLLGQRPEEVATDE